MAHHFSIMTKTSWFFCVLEAKSINSTYFANFGWPLFLAVLVTIFTSLFVQGAEGATFAMVPMVKKRITGQVAGMTGAYGNVGAAVYLTLYTFVTPQQFFFILAGEAFISFVICFSTLEEPQNSFSEDYYYSEDDPALAQESDEKIAAKEAAANKR